MKEYICKEDIIKDIKAVLSAIDTKPSEAEIISRVNDMPTVTKADIARELTERLHQECRTYLGKYNDKIVIDLDKWYAIVEEMERGE